MSRLVPSSALMAPFSLFLAAAASQFAQASPTDVVTGWSTSPTQTGPGEHTSHTLSDQTIATVVLLYIHYDITQACLQLR